MDTQTTRLTLRLAAAGCRQPEQAAANLGRMAEDAAARTQLELVLPALLAALRKVPDPDLALNNLERFAQKVLDRHFLLSLFRDNPRILHLALTIFGNSQFLSDILVRHPQFFEWLLEPGVLTRPRPKDDLLNEARQYTSAAATPERKWGALRRFKAQEILRIGLQDLVGRQSLAGITEELANLADVVLEVATEFCRIELVRRHGPPQLPDAAGRPRECPFTILGMGKLGGRELNFSSDIDLIFIYEEDGETAGTVGAAGETAGRLSHQEFFRKLGELLVKGCMEGTPEGSLYRVDLRLRPEGRSGAIAASLRSCELYYESWGQTWERQALIKARPVAGDGGLGAAFLQMMRPFVYRQSLDPAALEEIRAMKDRITVTGGLDRRGRRNVKLGAGGIREIEFFTQGLQLLHGGRNPWVRETNTLRALHRLAGQGLLADADYEALVHAYTFLRRLEHRLQIMHDRQTHALPEEPRELDRVARRMGYIPPEHPDPGLALLADYERHTRRVQQRYDDFLKGTRAATEGEEDAPADPADPATLFFTADLPLEALRPRVLSAGFDEPERALRNLGLMRDGEAFARAVPEVRRALGRLAPGLLDACGQAPDPDLALSTFERFLAGAAAGGSVLPLLAETPGLLGVLVQLFGSSEFLAATLLRQPELLDVLLASEPTAPADAARLRLEFRQAVAAAPAGSAKLDALRRIKKGVELRIGLADVAGGGDVVETQRALTGLAEACLVVGLEMAEQDLAARFGAPEPPGFAVLGMGKLGGGELGYGSDLDVVFVYRDEGESQGPERISHHEYFSKLADRLTKILTSITQEGAAYRVDARLRPGGQKGELAVSLAAVETHFVRMAEPWERQAYLKARMVAGDPALGEALLAAVERFVFERPPEADLRERILAMRQRMEAERAGKTQGAHVKLGSGGIVDVEFLVQFLQLRHGREAVALRAPGTLAALGALADAGRLPGPEAQALRDAYRFLRRVEMRLRIVADLGVSTLPAAPAKLEKLARRLGYAPRPDAAAREQFLADYAAQTARVREIFSRVFVEAGAVPPAGGEPCSR
jgi:[glutamine synthetase] adenylyltransferase / [glutamine synthetase]-adenylyl-L-tyrosine phosphorylase